MSWKWPGLSLILLAAVLMTPSSGAARIANPVPDVRIVMTRMPDGPPSQIATTDLQGDFSAQVRVEQAVHYTVAAVCARRGCPAHRMILSLIYNGKTYKLKPQPDGTYDVSIFWYGVHSLTLFGSVTGGA